jgi:hypothetical protein
MPTSSETNVVTPDKDRNKPVGLSKEESEDNKKQATEKLHSNNESQQPNEESDHQKQQATEKLHHNNESHKKSCHPNSLDNRKEGETSTDKQCEQVETQLSVYPTLQLVAKVSNEKWLAISNERKEYLLERNNITVHDKAAQLWSEVEAMIDFLAVQSGCLVSMAYDLFSRETAMIDQPKGIDSQNFRTICNIVNNKDERDLGHNLISHQIIRYAHNKNLVFTYKPLTMGNKIYQHKCWNRDKDRYFQFAYSRPCYSDLFQIKKIECMSCSLSCTKGWKKCDDCKQVLKHHRLETMRLSFITALQEVLPDDPELIDIVCRNTFQNTEDNNNLGLLFGYKCKNFSNHRLLRPLHLPLVGFDQLLSNIKKAVGEMKARRASRLIRNNCISWLDDCGVGLIESRAIKPITDKVMVATEKDTALLLLSAPDNDDPEPECLNKTKSQVAGLLKRRKNVEIVSHLRYVTQIEGKLLKDPPADHNDDNLGDVDVDTSKIGADEITADPKSGAISPDTRSGSRYMSEYKGVQHICHKRGSYLHQTDCEPFDPKKAVSMFKEYFENYDFKGNERDKRDGIDYKNFIEVVQIKTFSKEDLDSRNPHVFVARDVIGSNLKQQLVNLARTELFVKGVRGGKDTFMRASTIEPVEGSSVPSFPSTPEYVKNDKTKMYPFMLIGRNGSERLFKCFQATELEKKLMKLADKIVMITSAGQIKCQHNLLQWVISSADKCYDFHTDANEWTTMGGDKNDTYRHSSGHPLPSVEEAFTLTIAITRFPDIQKAVKITWKRDITNSRWSVVLSGNELHFQLPLTQAFGILHAGEKCSDREMSDVLTRIGKKITQSLRSTEELADLSSNMEGNWRMALSF